MSNQEDHKDPPPPPAGGKKSIGLIDPEKQTLLGRGIIGRGSGGSVGTFEPTSSYDTIIGGRGSLAALSTKSNNHRRSRSYSGDENAGVFVDEDGQVVFRFRHDSAYDPPALYPELEHEGEEIKEHWEELEEALLRQASTPSLGFGLAGVSGPLITLAAREKRRLTEITEPEPEKRKKIGVQGCIMIIIGCVLGSGIFAAPQEILAYTQSPGTTLLVWFTYGMIALTGALCYIELACTIPVVGGDYAYLNECFGSKAGFIFQLLANVILIPTIIAIFGKVSAKNLINPYLHHGCLGTSTNLATTCLACIFLFTTLYINYKSTEFAARIQGWLMIINFSTIALVVLCGIIHMGRFGVENRDGFKLAFPHPSKARKIESRNSNPFVFAVVNLDLALFQASFSYSGYTYVAYVLEDVENPLRTLPMALCISIPIVIVVNCLVNFCYLGSIPLDRLAQTETVASDMMKSIYRNPEDFPSGLLWIAPTLVSIAVLGGLMSNVLTCSRVSCIGARNGHFPSVFRLVHKDSVTPVPSLMFMGLMGGLFSFINETGTLIGICAYIVSGINCSVIYGLLYFRFTEPELPRPFKLPLIVPLLYAGTTTLLLIIPVILVDAYTYQDTIPQVLGALVVAILGIPLYYIFVLRRWKHIRSAQGKLVRFLQKTFLLLPEHQPLGIRVTRHSMDSTTDDKDGSGFARLIEVGDTMSGSKETD